jgi:hypothetical protein
MSEFPFTPRELALIVMVFAAVALVAMVARLFLPRRPGPAHRPAPRPAASGPGAFHQQMVAGREYMIVRSFNDYDGALRSAGERWVFKGYDFLPYDDGLTLFTDPGPNVRLQWRPETQGDIIDNLGDYIRAV